MTEDKIKEMYKSLANGDEWECKPNAICAEECQPKCDLCDWRPYKLGDEIIPDWEYRQIEKWYVVKETNQTFSICPFEKAKQYNPIYFEGSKEECEKWIKENTKKTWLEERLEKVNARRGTRLECKDIIIEVCKKILEEIRTHEGIEQMTKFYIAEIIKDLGVEV